MMAMATVVYPSGWTLLVLAAIASSCPLEVYTDRSKGVAMKSRTDDEGSDWMDPAVVSARVATMAGLVSLSLIENLCVLKSCFNNSKCSAVQSSTR